ncbi:uncharacterized protein CANTADRAFT_23876 [Suhomyces tanzawaensis NRRL Y-17324]|uniref:RING-type domain-containing protein n=1 Tax=Suhomyces tanzawaensis NRRL Y-17324 TaxID=984487 RepID=A0A1E4SC11_9ASCO|nr:uncharacterized protein CANTADRAFT_23876 [Suhomyces tanzawaensis NRRL Y-17324]ODV77043.1 hypothetical protein CANTADRAFT_23876 [Suhomyces tanzawaensis NRRL Y-17324]
MADEDLKLWHGIDHTLTSNLLGKITSIIECSICSETMHVPFTTECGHSFCYECITSWFLNKLNCPSCRHEIEHRPVMNIQLKDIAKNITDLIIETRSDQLERDRIAKHRNECISGYEYDVKHNRAFGEIFKSALTFVDTSDGVPRCGNCHWEANGDVCLHCGTRFRVPQEDEYDSADDDDYPHEFGGDHPRNSEDEYDSADSFVDNRGFAEINRDRARDSDEDILSSDNLSADDWNGFGHEGTEGSPIELGGYDDDGNEDYYDSDDLREALDEFHDSHIQESDDVPISTRVRGTRRPFVITLSDEDE